MVFSPTSSNGILIADFYNTLEGFTETFNLTFKDASSNQNMNDMGFDFIIKKDNKVLFKGSDAHNNGKPRHEQ
jgi:outer membrane lipoprotein-sorting protein